MIDLSLKLPLLQFALRCVALLLFWFAFLLSNEELMKGAVSPILVHISVTLEARPKNKILLWER